jgi:hypothetical protein
MARIKAEMQTRYWERALVLFTKAEAAEVIRALTLIEGCDLDAGVNVGKRAMTAKQSAEAKLRAAIASMKPKRDVCANCGHHTSYHKNGQCQHVVSCWNDTCACDTYRGQR